MLSSVSIVASINNLCDPFTILEHTSTVPGTYDFYISPSNVTHASIRSQRQGFIQVQSWNTGKMLQYLTSL